MESSGCLMLFLNSKETRTENRETKWIYKFIKLRKCMLQHLLNNSYCLFPSFFLTLFFSVSYFAYQLLFFFSVGPWFQTRLQEARSSEREVPWCPLNGPYSHGNNESEERHLSSVAHEGPKMVGADLIRS